MLEMEVELSDEEFSRLVRTLIAPVSILIYEDPVDLDPIDRALYEKGLTKYEGPPKDSPIPFAATSKFSSAVSHRLAITHYGYHVLTQNRLKLILGLLDLGADKQAEAHIVCLTQEELPMLLTCDNNSIRTKAAERMQLCLASEEELWERFIKQRNGE